MSAGGVTSAPICKKRQAVTSIFSRRNATSQRMVASEPVIDRFGPRSTPISIALVTPCGRWSAALTEPTIRADREIVRDIVGERRRETRAPGSFSG